MSVLALLCLTACATVKNGSYQNVTIASEPAGADVSIECVPGKPLKLTTPAVARLRRKVDSCRVTLRKPGYVAQTVELDVVPSRMFWGNFGIAAVGVGFALSSDVEKLIYGLVGGPVLAGAAFGVDAMTGAGFKFEPHRVDVRLVPDQSSVPQVPSSTFFK